MTFLISRRLNQWNDLDYLQDWDKKWGTSCIGAPHLAMKFETREEAEASIERCRRLVPNWMNGKPIEYAVETYHPSRGAFYRDVPATEPTPQGNQFVIPGCEKDKSRGPKQMDLF